MNQNTISKNKFVPHQNSQSRGAEEYLRQPPYVPGFSYAAATLPSVGGSYTHDMNKQVQTAPAGLYSSSPSGPMTGAGPQHHQPGVGGPVPTPQSTSMVPTQAQQLNARPHMASMPNYSRQNASRQVPSMSRSSITTVVSQSAPPTLQQYGTVPLYSQQAAYTMSPQAAMLMPPHVLNYQRSNFAAPHQFSMPSSQAPMYHLPSNNWNSYNQTTLFFGQMSHMPSTCPQIPAPIQVQAGPKKTATYKGLPIIDPATGRDVREDITNEPSSQGAKDGSQSDVGNEDFAMIFAAKVSQAIAEDNQKVATNDTSELIADNSCELAPPEDEIKIPEFREQYNEQETVIRTENTTVPYCNRDSADVNSISEIVSIEKVNSIVSSEPVIVEMPKTMDYHNLNDTGKSEEYSVPPSTIEMPCRLESSEVADEVEKDVHIAVSNEISNSDENKESEITEVIPRPPPIEDENMSNSNSDDSIFKQPAPTVKSQQTLPKVKSQQNGDIHKSTNSVSVSKEEKPAVEVNKKKKNKKKDLNKRGESKEGGDMDAFLDKTEEVTPVAPTPQVQQPASQQSATPVAATVITRADSPVTVSVQESEIPDSESEKVQQNDTSVISDQLQDSPVLSGEEIDGKEAKESPAEEAPKNQITLKYNYKEDQWSPLNPEGKKQYDREFLLNLQSQPMSMKKPSNLPNLDVIKDKATLHKLNEVNNRIASAAQYQPRSGYTDPFEPAFARSNAPGRGPMHPGGVKGRGSIGRENKPPRKVINLNTPTNLQVKLHTAENAWAPSRKTEPECDDIRTQSLYKKVRGILNKLTPQKFATLVSQVKQLDITTEESLNGVIDLVFEKAIDEPNFSVPYANMCKHLALLKVASSIEGQFVNFRKLLLTKCQREFEKDRTDEQNREERIKLIQECETDEKKRQLQEDFEEEERKNRRRQLGNIRFIGELFKLGMLTESIMHQCIRKLLNQGDEDSLECLCRLLTTIGKELENEKKTNVALMESYFTDMKKIVDKRQTSSRVRFMLQDVIDLRVNNWVPRRDENNPKTIDQIHKEAEREAHEQQQMLQQMTFPKRMPDDRDRRKNRPPISEDGWNMSGKSSKGNYSVDPLKLKLTKPAEVESMQLGPGGKFSSWAKGSSGGTKSSSIEQDSRPAALQNNRYSVLAQEQPPPPLSYEARRTSQRSAASSRESSRGRNNQLPPPATRKTPSVSRERDNVIEAVKTFTRSGPPEQRPSESRRPLENQNINGKDVTVLKGADLSAEEIEKKTKPLIDEFLHNSDFEEAVRCVVELASSSTVCVFITSAVNQVLERSSQSRHMLGKLLHTLLKRKIIIMEQYNKGLKDVLEFVDEYALDIPLIWDYLGELMEPILDDDFISLAFLKDTLQPCIPSQTAGKLVSAVLLCASKKRGTLRVGEMWKESKLSWTDFLEPGGDVEDFVKSHKLEFTTKQVAEPKLKKQITPDDIKQNLQRLLHDYESNEEIFNWLERHIEGEMSPPMYRALVTAIYESVITGSGANCELNVSKLKDRMCILARYMDVNRNLELHAIFALQYLMNKLDHPKGILLQIFDLAYNEDFLSDDAFKQWEHCDDPAEQEGKGVAIHSVSSFFTWLKEGEDDESAEGD